MHNHLTLWAMQVSAYSSFARMGGSLTAEQQRRRMDPASNEPLFTNCTRDFIGTLDYIFYTGSSPMPANLQLSFLFILLTFCLFWFQRIRWQWNRYWSCWMKRAWGRTRLFHLQNGLLITLHFWLSSAACPRPDADSANTQMKQIFYGDTISCNRRLKTGPSGDD